MQTHNVFFPQNRRQCKLGNTATQINDALEATADFCREANDNKTPVPTQRMLTIFKFIKVSQFMAWFFLKITRQNLSLTKLIKKEGSFLHEFGTMPITIWNKQIETVEEGFYEMKNICHHVQQIN